MKPTISKSLVLFLVLALLTGTLQNTAPAFSQSDCSLNNPVAGSNDIVTWDCIYFGNYWQSDTNNDGTANKNDQKEPIKWRVLSLDGNDALLLADQNLDVQVYNDTWTSITWETCTMRSWLNGYGADKNAEERDFSENNFIENAFEVSEQSAIKTTNIINNQNNPEYNTNGGNDTQDKVYLLSIAEAMNPDYGFTSSADATKRRTSTNTAYTAAGGEIQYNGMKGEGYSDFWWLRSPGNSLSNICNVYSSGNVYMTGNGASIPQCAVRPALHLDLSSSVWTYAGKVTSEGKAIAPATPAPTETTTPPTIAPTSSTSAIPTIAPTSSTSAAPTVAPTAAPSTSAAPTVTPVSATTAAPTAVPVPVSATPTLRSTKRPVISAKPKTPTPKTAVSAPAKVKGLSLKSGKKQLRVKWKKISGVKGYQIWYSTSKKFKKKKQKLVKKNAVTLKKLKKRKTYYVKVRAYKRNKKKKIYGKWSSVKKKKIRAKKI